MVQFKSRLHIQALRGFLNKKDSRTIANNTTAVVLGQNVIGIEYHGNRIAEVNDWDVYISNAGWNTPTTRTRINSVLADNYMPFFVHQKNHKQILSERIPVRNDDGTLNRYDFKVITDNFREGFFIMDAGMWRFTNA